MFAPLTERDIINPVSDFNLDMMMIGLIVALAVCLIATVAHYFQERYEDNDEDPYDGPRIV